MVDLEVDQTISDKVKKVIFVNEFLRDVERLMRILFLVPGGTYFHLELSHAVHTRLRKD